MSAASARALLTAARGRLQAAGIDSAALEARLLLANALGEPAEILLAEPDHAVPEAAEFRFQEILGRRLQREPLFYITGECEFYGLPFHVDARALIPRPETELLVEEAINAAREFAPHYTDGAGLRIADIGTGSGCIVVAIATVLTGAHFIATDISEEALDVARINAERHGVARRIDFRAGDLFAPVAEELDIVVANPPYIPLENLATLQAEIRNHEPYVAVNGGKGGITIAERLIRQAPPHMRSGGRFFMEVGYGQASVLVDIAADVFPAGTVIDMGIDLAGISRVVRIQHAPEKQQ